MGTIQIQDSGFIKSTNTGTQASAANRANSGSAITLRVATFTPAISRNFSNQPEIASNTPSEVNQGSLENMKFQLECKFDSNNDTDMALVKHILDMIRTNGYKFLWYDHSDATVEKNNGKLIYQIAQNSVFGNEFTTGEQSNFGVSGSFFHLHVFFFDFQPKKDSRSSIIPYTLKGIIIPSETSSI